MLARLAALIIALALGAAGVASSAGGSHESSATSPRLPDLDQEVPWNLEVTGNEARGRYRLAFSSAVRNVGAGPLIISGHRRAARETMTVDQLIERANGSVRVIDDVGRMRYVRSSDHAHWHLLRFDRYALRRADGQARVVTDRKTGFCLGDRYRARGEELRRQPNEPVYTGRCGLGHTTLLHLIEGISVGYGDVYDPTLEGQTLRLTGLDDGRYRLIHRVNVRHRLRETSYANNAASLLLRLRWQAGRPSVRVLNSCPDTARCQGPLHFGFDSGGL